MASVCPDPAASCRRRLGFGLAFFHPGFHHAEHAKRPAAVVAQAFQHLPPNRDRPFPQLAAYSRCPGCGGRARTPRTARNEILATPSRCKLLGRAMICTRFAQLGATFVGALRPQFEPAWTSVCRARRQHGAGTCCGL